MLSDVLRLRFVAFISPTLSNSNYLNYRRNVRLAGNHDRRIRQIERAEKLDRLPSGQISIESLFHCVLCNDMMMVWCVSVALVLISVSFKFYFPHQQKVGIIID